MPKAKSMLEFAVLHSLRQGSKNGYALMLQVEKDMGAKPSPGSMYPLLSNLKKKELVSVREAGNKKIYTLTVKGKQVFKQLQKHKQDYVNHMKSHVKMLESITGHKQTDILRMFDRLKKGKMPFLWLLPDALRLRKTLLYLVHTVEDKKKQEKIKNIIRKTVKELQHI